MSRASGPALVCRRGDRKNSRTPGRLDRRRIGPPERSPRHRQIVSDVGKETNHEHDQEISEELFLSPQTVSTHRYSILNKMGMITNAELIEYAIQAGLLT